METTAYERMITEQLISTFAAGSEQAFLSVLEEMATRIRIKTLDDGLPIRESFYRRKACHAEYLIADFADTNPVAASDVKALWSELNAEGKKAIS